MKSQYGTATTSPQQQQPIMTVHTEPHRNQQVLSCEKRGGRGADLARAKDTRSSTTGGETA